MAMSKIRCLHCGNIIESKYRHDWQCCSCYPKHTLNGGHGVYIDGGDDYFRIGGNLKEFEIVLDLEEEEV